ncbi:MAG: hypothetical protein FJ303_03210 [Planctomycetes bacterium]|nr:hypothetical protein [Planctomycetota bacterium]
MSDAISGDLGPVLVSGQRLDRVAVAFALGGASFLFLGSAGLITTIFTPGHTWLFSGVLAAIGIFVLIYSWFAFTHWFLVWHLHQHGVRTLRSGKEHTLRYDQVHALTIDCPQHGSQDIYFELKSENAHDEALVFSCRSRATGMSPTEMLDRDQTLRIVERITVAIVKRLCDALTRGETVRWTDRLAIRTDGVEIRKSDGHAFLVEWQRIVRLVLHKGEFHLWTEASREPVMKEPLNTPNCMACVRIVTMRIACQGDASAAENEGFAVRGTVVSAARNAEGSLTLTIEQTHGHTLEIALDPSCAFDGTMVGEVVEGTVLLDGADLKLFGLKKS